MYAGPTNGGVMPMTNASWGTVVINGETRAQCPLSATEMVSTADHSWSCRRLLG